MHRRLAPALALVAALARSSPASAAEGAFRVAPYAQAVSAETADVRFEPAHPAAATVALTPAGGKARTARVDAKGFVSVPFDGLAPATRYSFEVRLAGGGAEKGSFVTAPTDARAFSFAVFGDTRSDDTAHEALVAALGKVTGDFLVNTGDLVASGDESGLWDRFFVIERDLLAARPVYAVVGNHELYGERGVGGGRFAAYFGARDASGERLYGTFRWGTTRFFLLNAMDDWRGPERAWLAKALDDAEHEPGLQHRIAVLHHGPFSSGPHGPNAAMQAAGVVDLLAKEGVDLVIAGHDHIYERGELGGLHYLISGGGGAPLYELRPAPPTTLASESAHHWIEVSVDGPRVAIVSRRVDGSTMERCAFDVGKPWACEVALPPPLRAPVGAPVSSKPAGAAPVAPIAPAPASRCACRLAGPAPSSGSAALLGALGVVVACLLRRRRGV